MHSFKKLHPHLLATSMHQPDMCLLLLKVEQSAFTQAFSQACLGSTSARVAFKYPIFLPWQADSQLLITTRLADEFGHGFSYFV